MCIKFHLDDLKTVKGIWEINFQKQTNLATVIIMNYRIYLKTLCSNPYNKDLYYKAVEVY